MWQSQHKKIIKGLFLQRGEGRLQNACLMFLICTQFNREVSSLPFFALERMQDEEHFVQIL